MLEYKIVEGKSDCEGEKEHLKVLFNTCYGRELSEQVWRHYYVDNPFGPSFSITAWSDGRLVGHYGAIPQLALNSSGTRRKYALGLTLAVLAEVRKQGVFARLMAEMANIARCRGYDFLLGFPNDKSWVPLSVFCGWKLLHGSAMNLVPVGEIEGEVDSLKEEWIIPPSGFSPPYTDKEYMSWRSRFSPIYSFIADNKIVIICKAYSNQTLDILDVYKLKEGDGIVYQAALKTIASHLKCAQICITERHAEILGIAGKCLRPFGHTVRMAGVPLSNTSFPNMHFSLLFSDVYL